MFTLLPEIQQKIQQRIIKEVLKRVTITTQQQPVEFVERPYRATRIGFGGSL